MDRVVMQSHFLLSRGSNFKAGARALIAADGLLYAGANGRRSGRAEEEGGTPAVEACPNNSP